MWEQPIEYEYSVKTPRPPVKKQIWNGKQFVPATLYKHSGSLSDKQKIWLFDNFGARGPRWNYSLTGNFWVMDEQVYAWFQIKWGNK